MQGERAPRPANTGLMWLIYMIYIVAVFGTALMIASVRGVWLSQTMWCSR